MFLDEIMRSLINQGLKGWQGFKPWTLGINVDHYKRRKIVNIKDPILSKKP